MQRRDWSYKDAYKPRWIIYCTTAIAPMIVEGAEIKPSGARTAPQDHVAVIIPNDQWSPSQQGEEEEEEDDWSEFMPSCQVFSAKSKAYEELDKWQPWSEMYEPDEIVDLNPDPKTMRMSPSKPPTPKKKQPQGDPPAQPCPRTRRRGTCRSCSTSRSTSSSCTRRRRTSPTTRRRGTSGGATRRRDNRRRRSSPERRRGTKRSNPRRRLKCTRRRGHSPSCSRGRRPKTSMGEAVGVRSGGHKH